MSIFERSVTCRILFANFNHLLTRTLERKFEDVFPVKTANSEIP